MELGSSFACLVAGLSDSKASTVSRVPAHGLFVWVGLLSVAAGSERGHVERGCSLGLRQRLQGFSLARLRNHGMTLLSHYFDKYKSES